MLGEQERESFLPICCRPVTEVSPQRRLACLTRTPGGSGKITEETMTCIICHGEQVSPAEVSEEIPVGSDIVRVPVTVMVCRTCGER
jgi:hypothetical protein